MTIKTIVKTTMLVSLLFGSICHANTSSGGMATGKRQHAPTPVTKPIDKATPTMARGSSSSAQIESSQNARSAYRLCPDGTMVYPGEKCPEKNAKK